MSITCHVSAMRKETQGKPKPFRPCTLIAAASTLKTVFTEDDIDHAVLLQPPSGQVL